MFSAGYTFSKSLDQSSSLGEEVNPIDPALSKAISAFDVKHNFVVSYYLPDPDRKVVPRRKSLDQGLGALRHHAFQHRIPGYVD